MYLSAGVFEPFVAKADLADYPICADLILLSCGLRKTRLLRCPAFRVGLVRPGRAGGFMKQSDDKFTREQNIRFYLQRVTYYIKKCHELGYSAVEQLPSIYSKAARETKLPAEARDHLSAEAEREINQDWNGALQKELDELRKGKGRK